MAKPLRMSDWPPPFMTHAPPPRDALIFASSASSLRRRSSSKMSSPLLGFLLELHLSQVAPLPLLPFSVRLAPARVEP